MTEPRRSLAAVLVRLIFGGLLLPAIAAAARAEEEDESDRVKITTWKFLRVADPGADCRSLDYDAMARFVAEALRRNPEDVGAAKKVFDRYSFGQIEALLKAKKADGISAENSSGLAEARREMIRRSMVAALRELDPSGALHVGLLDSGNKGSGIASDVDQTVFIWPREEAIRLGIDEGKLIAAFDRRFAADHGHPPSRFGIECMNGADFFPDWRQAHSVGEFSAEAKRVVLEKRANPEAYRSEGQLKSQAEGRGYVALQAFGRELERLDQESARIRSEIDDVERALAAGDDPALAAKRTELEGRLREVRAELSEVSRLSPWTEIGVDETGKVTARTDRDPRGKVLKTEPEMVERFAFDGAYDNWIMFEHHPHNRIKYLLRSVAEGVGVLFQRAGDASGAPRVVRPFDYDVEFGKGRRSQCDAFVASTYRHLEERGAGAGLTQERVRKALDTAAKARLRHKGAEKRGGGPWSLADVYSDYLPPDDGRLPMSIRLETAKARWEVDAREIMLENLLLTVRSAGDILTGRFGESDLAAIRARVPGAPADPNVLRVAAELQLFHGIHDLLSREHALELLEPDPAKRAELARRRMKDPVDRLLAEVERSGDRGYREKLAFLARRAAASRVAADPHFAKDPSLGEAVLSVARDAMREQIHSAYDAYRTVADGFRSGEYTPEVVATRVLTGLFSRAGGIAAEVLDAAGFQGHVSVLMPNQDHKLPALEIEFGQPAFSGRKLLVNMFSSGNLDSALQVTEAYLDGGADAAAWALAREIVMNFPGVAQGAAAYEAVAHGRPQAAFMMGTAMFIPGVGQAYILVSIATTSVRIGGKIVLEPLKNDVADRIYQGFLGPESGFRSDERSQRAGLLDPVEVRVIPFARRDEDGKPLRDAAGKERVFYAIGPYSAEEALRLEIVKTPEQAAFAREAGLLGGGEDFERELPRARDWLRHPRLVFEAKRASLFPYCERRVEEFLRARGLEELEDLLVLRGRDGAGQHLREFFLAWVRDWIHGTGEFEGRADAENEVLVDRVAPPDRAAERLAFEQRLADRMVGDFLSSRALVRAGEGSLEEGLRRNAEAAWLAQLRFQVAQAMVAIEDARRRALAPALASAIHEGVLDRGPTVPAPRIKVRPRVVASGAAGEESLDVSVSVIADPERHPPPYSFRATYGTAVVADGVAVTVDVTAIDARGREVGRVPRTDVGVLALEREAAPSPDTPAVEGPVSFVVAPERPGATGVTVENAHLECDFAADGLLSIEKIWAFFDHPMLESDSMDWQVVRGDGVLAAFGTAHASARRERTGVSGRGAPVPKTACAFFVREKRAGNFAFEVRRAFGGASLLGTGDVEPAPWERIGTFRLDRPLLHFQGFVVEAPPDGAIRNSSYPELRVAWFPPRVDLAAARVEAEIEAVWLPFNARERARSRSRLELDFPREMDPVADEMGEIRYRIAAVEGGGEAVFRGGIARLVATRNPPPTRKLGAYPPEGPPYFAALTNRNVPGGLGALDRLSAETGDFGVPNHSGTMTVRYFAPIVAGDPPLPLVAHLRGGSLFTFPVRMSFASSGYAYGFALYGMKAEPYSGPLPPGSSAAPGSTASGTRDPSPSAGPGGAARTDPNAGPGGGARPRSGPVDPSTLDPNAPDVAPLIREWIAVAEPPENATEGARLHYNEWGLRIGSTRTAIITGTPGRPDAASGRTPEAYVWSLRDGLDSVDHCTLGEYVIAKLEGRSTEWCRGRYRAPAPRVVPDFRGATVAAARERAASAGVRVRTVGGDPAPRPVDEFTVQSQDPAPGGAAAPDGTVTIRVFGPYARTFAVPDVSGLTAGEARSRLEASGFVVRLVGGDPAPSAAAAFRVQSQHPPPGDALTRGGEVVVRVHSGVAREPESAVPDVRGLPLTRARAALAAAGFAVSTAGGDPAPSPERAFTVQSQDPPAGAPLARGAAVALRVHSTFVAAAAEPPAPPDPPRRDVPPRRDPAPSAPYFVGLRHFQPKPLRGAPEGAKLKDYLRGLGVADVTWEAVPTPVFLHVTGEAVAFYGAGFFVPGERVGMSIRMAGTDARSGRRIDVGGALLFEVERVAATSAELAAAYGPRAPRLDQPNAVLVIDRADGTFDNSLSNESGSGRLTGGPVKKGWSEDMKRENLRFVRDFAELFDCFLATAVYAAPEGPELAVFRRFRDRTLARSEAGSRLIEAYYRVGPRLARAIRSAPELRRLLRPAFDRLARVLDSEAARSPFGRLAAELAVAGLESRVTPFVPLASERTFFSSFDPFDPGGPFPLLAAPEGTR